MQYWGMTLICKKLVLWIFQVPTAFYNISKDDICFLFLFSYAGGYNASEFGDFTVVHALTGWLPEIIPLR